MLNAYDYYEQKKSGLENHFLDTVEAYLERVQKNPLRYQIKRKPYKEVLIKDLSFLRFFNSWRNPKNK